MDALQAGNSMRVLLQAMRIVGAKLKYDQAKDASLTERNYFLVRSVLYEHEETVAKSILSEVEQQGKEEAGKI